MAKQTGIGARLWFESYDLSGDVGAIDNIAESRAMIDVTGIDKEFFERLPGLGDGEITFSGFFNPTNNHAALKPMGTAQKIVTAAFGTAIGSPAASLAGAQVAYSPTRAQGGALTTTANFTSFAGYGCQWGVLLANAQQAQSGTATATVDNTAASTGGAAAYVNVLSVVGTPTIIIEDSADNSSFATITGMSQASVSAGTAFRLASSGTAIRRYARVNVSGGTATLAVNFYRGL